jgi:hypothetical protein
VDGPLRLSIVAGFKERSNRTGVGAILYPLVRHHHERDIMRDMTEGEQQRHLITVFGAIIDVAYLSVFGFYRDRSTPVSRCASYSAAILKFRE